MLPIFVQNHKARDPSAFVARVRAEGHEPVVVTDQSDYRRTRGKAPGYGRGVLETYLRILQAIAEQPWPWAIVLQDDISVPAGLFTRMQHVLNYAPGGGVAFYVPTNALFARARAEGHHVVETYWQYWIQAMAWRPALAAQLFDWGTRHCILEEANGCDGFFLARATSRMQEPVRVVMPSFVQHLGARHSLLGTSGKVGRYERTADWYEPAFDPQSVDWEAAFATPLHDRSKLMKTKGLRDIA